jgi:hypothetical protein
MVCLIDIRVKERPSDSDSTANVPRSKLVAAASSEDKAGFAGDV